VACDPTWLPAQLYADENDLLCGDCGEGIEFDSDVWAWAKLAASRAVYDVTGGKYPGRITTRIRPCRRACSSTAEWTRYRDLLTREHALPAVPVVVDAQPAPLLVNLWACRCDEDPCSCSVRDHLVLPYRPVCSVSQVMLDGEVFEDWVLQGGRLYRTDGKPWPSCNDLTKADTEPGTWSVTFTFGRTIPPEAAPLVAAYACELAHQACGHDCDLPDGVRVVSRPGIEYALVDYQWRSQKLTGFQPLDEWIVRDRGGVRRATERSRLWTRGRAQQARHRVESMVANPPPDVTGDGVMRETLYLRRNEDRTKTVEYPGRPVTHGRLTVKDVNGDVVVDELADIVSGVAVFNIPAGSWAMPPAGIGSWDMVVQVQGGGIDVVAAGPVRFYAGVAEPVF
jgi:hypothetical protein